MLNFKDVKQIPNSAIYAFVSERNKAIYVSHTTCFFIELSKHLDELYRGVHRSKELQKMYDDCNTDVECLILKDFSDDEHPIVLRASYGAELDLYKAHGYKDLREDYSPGEFRLRTKMAVLEDKRVPCMLVYAESKRREKYLLGCFESVDQGKAFIAANFPSNERIVPVFADNELTKTIHATKGYKLE